MTLNEKKVLCDGFTFDKNSTQRIEFIYWNDILDSMIDFNQALDELAYNNFDEEFIDAKNKLVKKYLGKEFLPRGKK
jgi:hypothetical protein